MNVMRVIALIMTTGKGVAMRGGSCHRRLHILQALILDVLMSSAVVLVATALSSCSPARSDLAVPQEGGSTAVMVGPGGLLRFDSDNGLILPQGWVYRLGRVEQHWDADWQMQAPLRRRAVEMRAYVESLAAAQHLTPLWCQDGRSAILHKPLPQVERERLVAELTSTDVLVRADAAWRARAHADAGLIPALAKATQDADATVSAWALQTLRSYGWRPVLVLAPGLARTVLAESQAADPERRRLAMGVMDLIPRAQAMTRLQAAIKEHANDSGHFLVETAEALGWMEGPEVVNLLGRLLVHPSTSVRPTAACSLGRVGGVTARDLLLEAILDQDIDAVGSYLVGLSWIDPQATARHLEHILLTGSDRRKQYLLNWFWAMRIPDQTSMLLRYLADPAPEVQEGARRALQDVCGEESPQVLERLLADPEVRVRTCAVQSLHRRDPSRALTLLKTWAKDPSAEIRRNAVCGCSGGSAPRVLPLLARLQDDADITLRAMVADSLALMPAAGTTRLFTKALADKQASVRCAAVRAAVHHPAIVDVLIPLLEDGDVQVRLATTMTITKIGSPRQVSLLAPRLVDADLHVALGSVQALVRNRPDAASVALLGEALADHRYDLRRAIITGLGRIGGPQALDHLELLVTDEDASIRQAVASALGAVDGERAFASLEWLTLDEDSSVRIWAIEVWRHCGSR